MYQKYAREKVGYRQVEIDAVKALQDAQNRSQVDRTVRPSHRPKPISKATEAKLKHHSTVVDHKSKINSRINNSELLKEARDSLIEKTGKDSFSMDEISKEIMRLHPVAGAKFK